MRHIFFLFGLCSMLTVSAQHHHYLMLQSDHQQPFYVRMGTTVQSSSADGFMIIARLKDSAYEMVVGFPSRKFPEYQFRFAGFKKDRGMALKQFDDKGWGLFDYQTLEVVMGEKIPEKTVAAAPPPPPPLTADPFAVVLASAIGDPGLLATPLVQMGQETYMVSAQPRPAVNRTEVTPSAAPGNSAVRAEPPASAAAPPSVPKQETIVAAAKTEPLAAPKDSMRNTAKAEPVASLTPPPSIPKQETIVAAAKTEPLAAPKDTLLTTAKTGTIVPARDSGVVAAAPPPSIPKQEPVQTLTPDKPIVAKQETSAAQPLLAQTSPIRPVQLPGVRTLPDGMEYHYLDGDTVDVWIPLDRPATTPAPVVAITDARPEPVKAQETRPVETVVDKAPVKERPVETVTDKAPVKERPVETVVDKAPPKERPAETAVGKAPVKEEMTVRDTPTEPAAAPNPPNRTGCTRMATEKDLTAIKKKILGISDEDDMVAAVMKDVKARCYTTEQVRTLSFVFTRQEGKYKLMDAVYPYVYDPSNFPQLEPLLTDKYFIHRFRALVSR